MGIDNPYVIGHNVGETNVVRDDFGEAEYEGHVPDMFRYVGFCIVNGTIVHYYI